MIRFFIKKNFFDGWDNMMSLLLPNIVIVMVLTGLSFAAHYVIESSIALSYVFICLGAVFAIICSFAFGNNAYDIAESKYITAKDFFKELLPSLKDALLFSIIVIMLGVLTFVAIPFYFEMGNILGLLLASLVFWIVIISILALQWFLPIRSIMKNSFGKCLKKSFLLFFDNPGFSIFLFFYNLFLLILSIPLFFILPGFSGVILAQVNAVRLRLYKYDWLDEQENINRKNRKIIPWDELLKDDNEAIGDRNLRSFIFPGRGK